MVTITSLWLAILVSSLIVWIASAIAWTVSPHHKSDYQKLPDEDAARNALKPQNLKPGQYNIPHIESMEEMKKPEAQKKFTEGPVGFFTVLPNRIPSMGKNMVLSFVFYLVVGIFVAYVAGRSLEPTAHYLSVFRITGTIAFLAYGVGSIPDSIWFGRPWSASFKQLVDSLVYGLLTAGTFGWLWPN